MNYDKIKTEFQPSDFEEAEGRVIVTFDDFKKAAKFFDKLDSLRIIYDLEKLEPEEDHDVTEYIYSFSKVDAGRIEEGL